ncbi:MAG: DUF1273 domain-containing protein [Clostridiales bacterium]|nr:DUF1273 domain-containing protein [Clostridiales bacterium]
MSKQTWTCRKCGQSVEAETWSEDVGLVEYLYKCSCGHAEHWAYGQYEYGGPEITFCFTGHRPDKLGGYDWSTPKNQAVIKVLRSKLITLISEHTGESITFICGGALGIDQMSFEIVQELRTTVCKDENIRLVLAMPFEKQDANWYNKKDVEKLRQQRCQADEVVLVDTIPKYQRHTSPIGTYHPLKMQLRNEYMVDRSDVVMAVWNGTKGGTANCVTYAKKKGKEIIQINPDEIQV